MYHATERQPKIGENFVSAGPQLFFHPSRRTSVCVQPLAARTEWKAVPSVHLRVSPRASCEDLLPQT